MRLPLILIATTALAACSGGGPTTVGGAAVGSSNTGGGTTPAGTDIYAEFTKPTKATTYSGIGGAQVFSYSTDTRLCCEQQSQLFAAHTSTPRDTIIQVTYDPREATYTLVVNDPLNGTATSTRFQDPASRTNFGGAKEPQWGVSNFSNPNINYLQAGDGNPLSLYDNSGTGAVNPGNNTTPADGDAGATFQSTTFFFETPGSNTKYVGLAGFVRDSFAWKDVQAGASVVRQQIWHIEHGAFAYGALTDINLVPKTGTATFNGNMAASMVFNPTIDGKFGPVLSTYFQWIEGTATTTVDFGANTVGLSLAGTIFAPHYDRYTNNQAVSVAAGTSFSATGSGTIDLIHNGGFFGQFSAASVGATLNGSPTALLIAGSSFDGAFFGPKGQEVGGGFHIAGGTPDQRIDILGGYTGK